MSTSKHILFVAATQIEIKTIKKWWDDYAHLHPDLSLTFLITEVGMPWTVYHLTKELMERNYDLIVQIGIAGAYNRDLEIGDVVAVLTEIHGDLGYEEVDETVQALDEFSGEYDRVITNMSLNKWFTFEIPKVIGLTVDTTSGIIETVERRTWQYGADIESMEGFAFHLVASQFKVPYVQIRAISNPIEQRNKDHWDIPFALKNLNHFLVFEFIPSLELLNYV